MQLPLALPQLEHRLHLPAHQEAQLTAACAPAAERNKGPLLEVLARVLPAEGLVLEIASGTGQHAVFFAAGLPGLVWQPSDPDPAARASIAAWIAKTGLTNAAAPLVLDVAERPWPVPRADALVCINMIHISPWSCTEALFAGAADVLPTGAPVVTYGPYRREGRHTAPSNEAFDTSLRARNPEWGVRDLEDVAEAASRVGLALEEVVTMPANNFTLVFRCG